MSPTMMPPKTPVSIDGMPITGVVARPRILAKVPIAASRTP
jgi:hypothetical protein